MTETGGLAQSPVLPHSADMGIIGHGIAMFMNLGLQCNE